MSDFLSALGGAALDLISGADFFMILGNLVLFDFEVPEQVRDGLKQSFAMRKYPGGARTVDAMGPDYAPVSWEGWFEGPTAELRWDTLASMAAQGLPVPLTWSTRSKLVLITEVMIKYRRYYHISYSVTCEVIQDLTAPITSDDLPLDTGISNAVGAALLAAEQIQTFVA